MVSQLAFSVITPILLCTYVGYILDKHMGTRWIMLLLVILGTLAGGRLAYRQAKIMLEKEVDEDKRSQQETKNSSIKVDIKKPKRKSRISGEEVYHNDKK